MPVSIYRRQNPDDSIANAIVQAQQGLLQGMNLTKQRRQDSLAEALTVAKIQELQRKNEALAQGVPDDNYFRDPYSGKLHKRSTPQGGGPVNPNLTAVEFDRYGNPKKYVDYSTKALSGDAARGYSGAMQGLGNIENIKGEFGLYEEGGKVQIDPGYQQKILGLKMAGLRGSPFEQGPAGILPFMLRNASGRQARDLALQYETLAENELRARTGAAANPFEYISTKSRIEPGLTDRPENIYNKLQEPQKFLGQAAEAVRPGSTAGLMKKGGRVMVDANGNRAMVYPDGSFKEI